MSGVNDIRSSFLQFFGRNGHAVVPSSSLVPRNDPTLMFTNAGMVQFKNVFTGVEKRPYVRATTAQKCVRAGGKHNDLDNVGYTARHHTFFEMLGNFSFGDYFKDHAIEFAWKLLTRDFGLPAEKLTVTVYYDDDEAFNLWRKIAGLPEARIIRIATSDNFWAMGDTGPCGPCSEIFYDHGEHIPGGPPGSPDADGDRFIEIWNLVFMQYRDVAATASGSTCRARRSTPAWGSSASPPCCRASTTITTSTCSAPSSAPAPTRTGVDPDGPQRASHRVIADHLRASAFLVADGVLPSNEGRGYVLRRIMRRAMRHAQMLGARDPLMWRLVPALVREMGQAYPELIRAEALISETLKLEETRFRSTLARGLAILEDETRRSATGGMLDGEIAFKLYDTYRLSARSDAGRAARARPRRRHRRRSTPRWSASAPRRGAPGRARARRRPKRSGSRLRERVGATEFLGYETESAEGVVRALVATASRSETLREARAARSSSTRRRSTPNPAGRSATSAKSPRQASAPKSPTRARSSATSSSTT